MQCGPSTISADYLVVATHVPLMSGAGAVRSTLLQADLFPYSTYAMHGRVAKGRLTEGLYWDTRLARTTTCASTSTPATTM